MSGCSALVRTAAFVVASAVLTACPQLLQDEFFVNIPGASVPVVSDGGAQEASPDQLRDASASGGPKGMAHPPPGPGRDAGPPPPPNPIQAALHSALVHRYRFDADAPLRDSVGGEDATAVGGATISDGAAVLAGTSPGQYIDLPNGLLANLSNASFEVWASWEVSDPSATTAQWQRIFDFGRNPSTVEGQQCVVDADATSLWLTPRNQSGKLELLCESCTGTTLLAPGSMSVGVAVQLVAVVDDDANLLRLYQNGEPVTSVAFAGSLSQITTCSGRTAPCDWNNWLGRSQHIEDPSFAGKILDFRIYSAALHADWIKGSYTAGPDADW